MKPVAVLAFSGGLDTCYCAKWLEDQGYEVHAVTVFTGGDEGELEAVRQRARAVQVAEHVVIDARKELFDDYLRYLVFANALRGDVYPLCVSVERVVQARRSAEYAASVNAVAIAHGSTGAGNDQVRFDIAYRTILPNVKVLAPVRDLAITRAEETKFLADRGVEIPAKTTMYSINRGLWGATVGGAETHKSDGVLPDEAYVLTAGVADRPTESEVLEIEFECGVPVALDGKKLDPVSLIEEVERRAGRYGVGRGVHVGDTILGIKGRVAFEAPAAAVLISAHRELEKLVLSRNQQSWKRTLGDLYGSFLHEAKMGDPLMRDIEAFLESSQKRVSGVAKVQLTSGQAVVLGATSPYSLLNSDLALYGEQTSLWNGAEAAAFAKIYGLQDTLLARLGSREGATHAHVD